MANIKQQIKRNITNEKKGLQTAAFKSAMRTAIKKVEIAVTNNNLVEAQAAFKIACSKLDKAQAKGIYHKNFVSRKKSKLSKLINTIA